MRDPRFISNHRGGLLSKGDDRSPAAWNKHARTDA
jgi:hypothetical protein